MRGLDPRIPLRGALPTWSGWPGQARPWPA